MYYSIQKYIHFTVAVIIVVTAAVLIKAEEKFEFKKFVRNVNNWKDPSFLNPNVDIKGPPDIKTLPRPAPKPAQRPRQRGADKRKDTTYWNGQFYRDVSPNTYFTTRNISTEYKFNLSVMDEVKRRFRRQMFNFWRVHNDTKLHTEMTLTVRACMMISNSYADATVDLRRYYVMKVPYFDNFEYEVGYLTYAIVQKYQSVMETFHLAHRKYALHNNTDYAPTSYMFYLYRVIVEASRNIIHLCNMMFDLKRKYVGHETVFSPALDETPKKRPKRPTFAFGNVNPSEVKYKEHENAKKKERKKRRQKEMAGLLEVATTTRTPRQGVFFIHYGWSIEDWWL